MRDEDSSIRGIAVIADRTILGGRGGGHRGVEPTRSPAQGPGRTRPSPSPVISSSARRSLRAPQPAFGSCGEFVRLEPRGCRTPCRQPVARLSMVPTVVSRSGERALKFCLQALRIAPPKSWNPGRSGSPAASFSKRRVRVPRRPFVACALADVSFRSCSPALEHPAARAAGHFGIRFQSFICDALPEFGSARANDHRSRPALSAYGIPNWRYRRPWQDSPDAVMTSASAAGRQTCASQKHSMATDTISTAICDAIAFRAKSAGRPGDFRGRPDRLDSVPSTRQSFGPPAAAR